MTVVFWVIIGIVLLFGIVVFRGAPYLPSKKRDLQTAFSKLYKLDEKDTLVDIGSGDGVVLRAAAKRGAKAVGYEINPVLVVLSRLLSWRDSRVSVRWADFWLTKLPDETTVVYTFGESRDIAKMAKYVSSESARLGKALYFISYGFDVPDLVAHAQEGPYFLYRLEP